MYELAALGAALSWTFAALLAGDLSRKLGGITFSRLRNVGVFLVLLIFVSAGQLWGSINSTNLGIILLSGFVGIAIGDTFLFSAMQRLGPRRAQILYACNAPITVLLGIMFLGERLTWSGVLGVILVFFGVVSAIMWGKPKTKGEAVHRWETTEGKLGIAIVLGLIAALGQAVGAIIIKPALDAGAHPMAVSTLRVGVSALFLTLMFTFRNIENPQTIRGQDWLKSTFNGVLAIGIGMSLLLYAFSIGDVGIASMLSTTQAVMLLPVIWIKTKQRPALGAWVGALMVIAGASIIFGL
ncbi:MAG: DMT family transporter [Arenicellales bacterium]